jgi:hypothetical protein
MMSPLPEGEKLAADDGGPQGARDGGCSLMPAVRSRRAGVVGRASCSGSDLARATRAYVDGVRLTDVAGARPRALS